MGVSEFTEMVTCFMRVTWAAAAGKLQLVGSMQPIKDVLSMEAHLSSGNLGARHSFGSNGKAFEEPEGFSVHIFLFEKSSIEVIFNVNGRTFS